MEELILRKLNLSQINFPTSLKRLIFDCCENYPSQIASNVQELEIKGSKDNSLDLSSLKLENFDHIKKLRLSYFHVNSLNLPSQLQELSLCTATKSNAQEILALNEETFGSLSDLKKLEIDGKNFSLLFSNHKEVQKENISYHFYIK